MISVGIIGEGKMGTNLFYYLLEMDLKLTLICSPEADEDRIRNQLKKKLNRSAEAGIIDEDRVKKILQSVRISKKIEDISSCDLIIESITEDAEIKKKLFLQLDRFASPECILTSNSSSIIPSRLVPAEQRRSLMAGLHFFYPVALKNIVEIIRMPETSQGTLGKIGAFLKTIHRDPILLDESNSFILNRIYLEFQNEGFLLVNAKEATISRVDRIVRDHFFPQGIFEFFDSVGLDVMLASIKNYTMDDPGRARYQPLILHLEKLVSEEKLGNKTGTGFYQGGVNDEPGDHNGDEALILKLRESYATAFRKFSASSGIPPAALKLLMDEYFGCDSPFII